MKTKEVPEPSARVLQQCFVKAVSDPDSVWRWLIIPLLDFAQVDVAEGFTIQPSSPDFSPGMLTASTTPPITSGTGTDLPEPVFRQTAARQSTKINGISDNLFYATGRTDTR